MSDKTEGVRSISDLAAWMQGQNLADLHRIEATLDLLATATRAEKAPNGRARPGAIGPWDIHTRPDGAVEWTVRPETTLRERHSWCLKPLSSVRAGGSIRVVLLGSSAAASFGYWGEFTLATAIERKLQAAWPGRAVEVIDLACVNATWGSILDAMQCAATLDPDIAVVFCGNNEAKTLEVLLNAELRHLQSAFSARWICDAPVIANYPALLHTCLNEHVANMARATADCARQMNARLVFVVPEFNLADWQPRERVPFHLSSANAQEWYGAVCAAECVLSSGNAAEALDRFDAIIEADGGLSRRSQWGRGQALLALGRTAEARHALINARDAGVGAIADGIPQITQGMIEAMRRTFAELGIPCVDLPALLGADSATGIPSRSQFLDYCHLSARGLDLLAAAVAHEIAGAGSASSIACEPSAKEQSLACLVAAIHNYHHGQPLEIVRDWLERSLESWDGIRPLLEFFADNLCGAWRERFSVEWFRRSGLLDMVGERYFFFYCKFFYHARFDHDMSALIHELLGQSVEGRQSALLARTAGMLPDSGGNLLSLFFLDRRQGFATGDRHAARVGWERPALEIYVTEPVSTCDFPLDGGTGDLVLHLEGTSLTRTVELQCAISINDMELGNWHLERLRQRLRVVLPRKHLKSGLNRLTFRWSGALTLADQPPGHSRRRHLRRYGYYPVVARIHQMRLEFDAGSTSPAPNEGDTGC
jgi:hypothetical protein